MPRTSRHLRSILAVGTGLAATYLLLFLKVYIIPRMAPWLFSVHPWNWKPTASHLAYEFLYTLLAVAVGGYLTSLLAPHSELAHAFVVGGSWGILMITDLILSAGDFYPAWWKVSAILLTVPATLSGGFLAKMQVQRRHRKGRRAT